MSYDTCRLSHLAANLRKQQDRERYTRVIEMAENLQARIKMMQTVKLSNDRRFQKLPPLINTQPTAADSGQILSAAPHQGNTASCVRGNDSNNNQWRFASNDISCNRQKTTNRAPPPHPPPSCSPPPTPPPSSLNIPIRYDSGILFPAETTTPTITNTKRQDKDLPPDPVLPPKVTLPVTPPASPQKSRKDVRFQLPEEEQGPCIIHIAKVKMIVNSCAVNMVIFKTRVSFKRINGWSGFLTRTYLMGKDILMSRTLVTPYQLFNATEINTKQPKLILKLSLALNTTIDADNESLTFTRRSVRNTAHAVAPFAAASDKAVKAALSKWIKIQTGLVKYF